MPITHKNINRDYFVTIDVKNSKVNAPANMKFYNSDKKTSNIYVQLLINMSDNPIIKDFAILENATDYTLTLNIIKPDKKTAIIRQGRLVNEEESLFEYDLDEECKDVAGDYICEFIIGCNVDGHNELSTSDSFTYTVKKSIFSSYTIPDQEQTQDIIDLVIENDKLYLKTAKGDKIGQGVNVISYDFVSSESASINTNTESPTPSVDNTTPSVDNTTPSADNTTENESTVSDSNNINDLTVENDKLYLKKSDGSKVGEGVNILSYEVVSSEKVIFPDINEEDVTE